MRNHEAGAFLFITPSLVLPLKGGEGTNETSPHRFFHRHPYRDFPHSLYRRRRQRDPRLANAAAGAARQPHYRVDISRRQLELTASIGSNQKKKFTIGVLPDSAVYYEARTDSLYQIPKGIVCAQFILESKWGVCNLGANNFFGLTYAAVKNYMPKQSFVWRMDLHADNNGFLTRRVPVRFARFASMGQCFETYGKYLAGSKLYKSAFKQKSAEKFVRVLARHYAEDPDYAIKLILIMRRYNLE